MLMMNKWRLDPGCKLGAESGGKSQNKAASRGLAYHRKIYKQLAALNLEGELYVEPWFKCIDHKVKKTMRQPDALIAYPENVGLVIEVKLNWKDGRDDKLLTEYLPIVKSASASTSSGLY